MEKLAFLERRRVIQEEIAGLRKMREDLALFGKRPKRFEERLMLDRRMKEALPDRKLSTAFVGLLAAE
jgi:hypothetical protein